MSHNTFGHLFRVTTWGESHGPALGCVVDGCPPGLPLEAADIQAYLDKRRPGQSRFTTQRQEPDAVEILSGVFPNGDGRQVTTGTPISLMIRNVDQRSKDYGDIVDKFRPGHADYTYWKKYGIRDFRGGGRSSARETVMRVAAGAIARKYLRERLGVSIQGYLAQLGPLVLEPKSLATVYDNPFFSPDPTRLQELEEYMVNLRREGDSVGARVNVIASGVPAGLGEPVFDRLDAQIAFAMMSINAVKGVEIGAGFRAVSQKGTEHSDEMTPQGFLSNNAGGILGGISTGQDVVVSVAVKPTSSIRLARRTLDKAGRPTTIETHGRHDPCVGIRATPICEAMLALTLMDHALRHRAQNADVACETPRVPAQASADAIARLKAAAAVENPDPDEA